MVDIYENCLVIKSITSSPKEELANRKKALICLMRCANNNELPFSRDALNTCLDMLEDLMDENLIIT